jgi:hypothetical protein
MASRTIAVPGLGLVDLMDPPSGDERSRFHHSPAFGSDSKPRLTDANKNTPIPIFGPTEWPGEPQLRTVACAVRFNPGSWPNGSTGLIRSFSIVGQIEWGSGAAIEIAQFDFENGLQLAVPATVIRVGIVVDGEASDGLPEGLKAIVTVGTGCPARVRPPRRTFFLAPFGFNGATIEGPIPPFARSWTWSAAVGAASPGVAIEFWSGPPGGGNSYLLQSFTAAQVADAFLRGQSTPTPNAARYWAVAGAAGVFVAGQLAFTLDL